MPLPPNTSRGRGRGRFNQNSSMLSMAEPEPFLPGLDPKTPPMAKLQVDRIDKSEPNVEPPPKGKKSKVPLLSQQHKSETPVQPQMEDLLTLPQKKIKSKHEKQILSQPEVLVESQAEPQIDTTSKYGIQAQSQEFMKCEVESQKVQIDPKCEPQIQRCSEIANLEPTRSDDSRKANDDDDLNELVCCSGVDIFGETSFIELSSCASRGSSCIYEDVLESEWDSVTDKLMKKREEIEFPACYSPVSSVVVLLGDEFDALHIEQESGISPETKSSESLENANSDLNSVISEYSGDATIHCGSIPAGNIYVSEKSGKDEIPEIPETTISLKPSDIIRSRLCDVRDVSEESFQKSEFRLKLESFLAKRLGEVLRAIPASSRGVLSRDKTFDSMVINGNGKEEEKDEDENGSRIPISEVVCHPEGNLDDWNPMQEDYNSGRNLGFAESYQPEALLTGGTQTLQDPRSIKDVVCKFNDGVTGKCFKGKHCPRAHPILTVKTTTDGEEEPELLRLDLQNYRSVVMLSMLPEKIPLEPDDEFLGVVVYTVSPLNFYVVRKEFLRACDDETDISLLCRHQAGLFSAMANLQYRRKLQFDRYLEGQVVAVYFDERNGDDVMTRIWHRAMVCTEVQIEIGPNASMTYVWVLLIDMGRKLKVPFNQVVSLPRKFSDAPPLAYKCWLRNVRPFGSDYSNAGKKYFNDLVAGQDVVVQVLSKANSAGVVFERDPYGVELQLRWTEPNTEHYTYSIPLGQTMASKNFGFYLNPLPGRPSLVKKCLSHGVSPAILDLLLKDKDEMTISKSVREEEKTSLTQLPKVTEKKNDMACNLKDTEPGMMVPEDTNQQKKSPVDPIPANSGPAVVLPNARRRRVKKRSDAAAANTEA